VITSVDFLRADVGLDNIIMGGCAFWFRMRIGRAWVRGRTIAPGRRFCLDYDEAESAFALSWPEIMLPLKGETHGPRPILADSIFANVVR